MFRRVLLHTSIAAYLIFTASGFLYTFARYDFPGVPHVLTHISYGMMAPYQADSEWNIGLRADGQLMDGTRERIDLHRYYPVGTGERSAREVLIGIRHGGDEALQKAYRSLAEQVMAHEADRGREYLSVTLLLEEWPRSPEGYEALRVAPYVQETHLITVLQ